MLENSIQQLQLLSMHLLNNLQTQPLQTVAHNRSQTNDFWTQQKNDVDQISIGEHFKIFLINQSSEIKRNRNTNKTNILDRSMKHIKYLKREQQSIQQIDSISDGLRSQNKCKKNKTERSYIKDKSQFLFKQFCQKIQRKSQPKKLQSKLQNYFQGQLDIKQTKKQKKIRSFGSFLQNMKGHILQSQNRSLRTKSGLSTQKKNQPQLKVKGSHKQLRQKYIKSNIRQKISNKKTLKSGSVEENKNKLLTIDNKTIESKQVKQKQIYFTKNRNDRCSHAKNSQSKNKEKQQSFSKTANRIHCSYKNFYSPFNGIQIRYISFENQDIFQRQSNCLENKNQNLAITSFKKPFNRISVKKTIAPSDIQKGIVFRYKQQSTNKLQQSIQGWKVQPLDGTNNDFSDQF